MNCSIPLIHIIAVAGLFTVPFAAAADDLGDLVRKAVAIADPSIVRLRIIGGEQSIDGEKVSSLVTTGIVISESGEILTSQFALQGNPEAVLIEGSGGNRSSATVVATDEVRRIVLLKAKEGKWIPAKPAAPESIEVGQYSIAAGRFYAASSSNVSVGIISALNRVHGMALQTDAKVSPINYGGPLLNLQGSVQGILVPLSPRAKANASAGVEWYDSGIGFAVPMNDALRVAEKLQSGKDLKQGRLGLRMSTKGVFSSDISAEQVLRGGPADAAGIKKGDRLVAVNGKPLERISLLEEAVSSAYAGDTVTIDVRRGQESLSLNVVLTEELPATIKGELGLLAVRTRGAKQTDAGAGLPNLQQLLNRLPQAPADRPERQNRPGGQDGRGKQNGEGPPKDPADNPQDKTTDFVEVVTMTEGAAADVGLPVRIELLKINGTSTTSLAELARAVADMNVGDVAKIEYRQPGNQEVQTAELTTRPSSETVAPISADVLEAVAAVGESAIQRLAELAKNAKKDRAAETDPAARGDDVEQKQNDNQKPGDDAQRRELNFDERGKAVVFSGTKNSGVLPGIVVLLSAHATAEDQILANWKPYLQAHQLLVAIPLNPEKSALTAEDIPLIMTTLTSLSSGGKADLGRIVVVADREQSRLAVQSVFGGPSPVRGIALTSGWISESDISGVDGSGNSVLMLETPEDAQRRVLLQTSRTDLKKLGFSVLSPSGKNASRSIADWSMRLRAF